VPLHGTAACLPRTLGRHRVGQVVVRFKRAWRSGVHAVVLDPLDFITRLVSLIPPPHFNGSLSRRARGESPRSQ
jgi:hypothetical protein